MSRQMNGKRYQYSPGNMASAIDMVKSGQMSRRQAAIMYNVPKSTLCDKLSGRTPEACVRPGPQTVLTISEEKVIVEYCKLMATIGYPITRQELLREVKRILDLDGRYTPFRNNLPGKDWFYAFKKRHSDLTERFAMGLGNQRAAINEEMIKHWFAELMKFLLKEVPDHAVLLKDPRRIFNADESGFPLCLKSGKVIAPTGARHVYQIVNSSKTQITVMVCFNAIGLFIPPMIVYPGERFRETGIECYPEALYGHSSNGWMDSDLFVEFLRHFLTTVKENDIPTPVLLFVDGHSTHLSLQAASFCSENGIILYCLVPNATHILQPCDVGFFSPMKSSWKRQVKSWQLKNLGQSLTKKNFPEVFKSAWDTVAHIEIAAHAFKRAGLFPLNPDGIDKTKLGPAAAVNRNLEPSTGPNTVTEAGDASATIVPDLHSATVSTETSSTFITDVAPNDVPNEYVTTDAIVNETYENMESTIDGISVQAITVATSPALSTSSIVSNNPILKSPAVYTIRRDPNYVSTAFSSLKVPEIKRKTAAKKITRKLPKAISGTDALRMLREREKKKFEEELAKLKRKEDRERKREEKKEESKRKAIERANKKNKRAMMALDRSPVCDLVFDPG